MQGDAWLVIVIGASGVVAIVLVGLVVRSIRPTDSPAAGSDFRRVTPEGDEGGSTYHISTRAWSFRSFGPWHRPRSVGHNLERAFARIDSIDPYAMPRRIGGALSEVGLLTEPPEEPDEPPTERPRNIWPFGQLRGRPQGKDDE